jgi:glycosyltransferase involved in cell wall biosynthesis
MLNPDTSMRQPFLSIIIPVRNGSTTIGRCLTAACAHRDEGTEVIVVDDGSIDGSAEIAGQFPCTLLRLGRCAGAGAARNAGAQHASGAYLFFIDADCILLESTLPAVRRAISEHTGAVIGGTYTMLPADSDFFSTFQSVFIHYHETCTSDPDYIASHALVINADTFRNIGGFPEQFLPMIEDVELSHRLCRAGHRLVMVPDILVRHIFGFTFRRSIANAFRKSRHWTQYSLHNGDILSNSGTASRGLKANVAAFLAGGVIALAAILTGNAVVVAAITIPLAASIAANRGLLRAFRSTNVPFFGLFATLFYLFVYPAPVAAGAITGLAQFAALPRRAGMERARS